MERIFDQIVSACIAAEDAEKLALLYHEVYGIGPWKIYEFDDYKSAVCTALNVAFELIEPKEGTPMHEFLVRRVGSAVLGLGMSLKKDYQETKAFLKEKGAALFEYEKGTPEMFAFADTYNDLGMWVKLGTKEAIVYDGLEHAKTIPEDASAPKVRRYAKVGHFCLSAEPVMKYVKRYNDEYGFGPWIIVDLNEGPITDRRVHGKLIPHKTVATNCFMCDVNFEINGGTDANSSYSEFVRKNGPGIHHVMMELCCDPKEYLEFLTKERGFEILQSGTMKTSGESFYYVGSEKELGFNLETFSKFPDPSDPPEYGPPLLGTYGE